MKTKILKPCGFLIVHGLYKYYLLSPEPVAKDSWQDNGTYRFVGVPCEIKIIREDGLPLYYSARHIVTNSFTIEYRTDIQPIEVELDEGENYE